MSFETSPLLEQFETFKVDPHEFDHRKHVCAAFEMLDKYNYIEACANYSHTINTIATNAGAAGMTTAAGIDFGYTDFFNR